MPHPFVHVELHTRDLPRACEFYSALFGWQLQDMPLAGGHTYTMINVGEGTAGGMMAEPDPKVPPYWLDYVGVDDIEDDTSRAKELGAKVVQGGSKVRERGWM
jgi:predicted enzyme related to lactoylglutathione lyase